MKSRKALIDELDQTVQRTATLTVLHTNAVASKIGLSATEFEAMDIISRYQPMSAGKLAHMCGLTTGAITGIVDRLEKGGFVRRERDPNDRRRVFLQPVENKRKSRMVCDLYEPMRRGFERIIHTCTDDEVKLLIDIHKKLNDEVELIIAKIHDK